jgi:hypothetical protein
MMKTLLAILGSLLLTSALADAPAPPAPAKASSGSPHHRYLVERTFPAGALDGLNAESKAKINATNAKFGVRWLMSYATADKTKTYCVYEGPSEEAIRKAASANSIPVDHVTEVPVTLRPK